MIAFTGRMESAWVALGLVLGQYCCTGTHLEEGDRRKLVREFVENGAHHLAAYDLGAEYIRHNVRLELSVLLAWGANRRVLTTMPLAWNWEAR